MTVAFWRATAVWERIRPFKVAPVSRVTEVAASTIPLKVAPVPMQTAPGTIQKIFVARAPPDRNTLVLADWVRVPATWKIQTACITMSAHILWIQRDHTVGRATGDGNGGWNSNRARIIVDALSESESTHTTSEGGEVSRSEYSRSRLGVGGDHVVDCCWKIRGGSGIIIRSIHLPRHLCWGGVGPTGSHSDRIETSEWGCSSGGDTHVSGDDGRWDGRNACFRKDYIVCRTTTMRFKYLSEQHYNVGRFSISDACGRLVHC